MLTTNIFLGQAGVGGMGQKPPIKGLHFNCDAHFRTRMSYPSQKSCVKNYFELVDIRGMLMVRGVEDPHGGGATCDLRCPFSKLAKLFQSKVMCENLVWIG